MGAAKGEAGGAAQAGDQQGEAKAVEPGQVLRLARKEKHKQEPAGNPEGETGDPERETQARAARAQAGEAKAGAARAQQGEAKAGEPGQLPRHFWESISYLVANQCQAGGAAQEGETPAGAYSHHIGGISDSAANVLF